VAGLVLAACGGGGSPTASNPAPTAPPTGPSAVVVLHRGNFTAIVGAEGVCLIDFYHPSCSHCRAMEPVVERLATEFQGQAVVGKVSVMADPALAEAWAVPGYPTFVVTRDGHEHSRWLGEASYSRLAGMIRTALDAP
jgi:thioredoxin 1